MAELVKQAPGRTLAVYAHPDDADVAYFGGVRGQVVRQERAAQVRAARAIFGELSRAALAPPESADLIRDLIKLAAG